MENPETAVISELCRGNWATLYNLSEEWLATDRNNPIPKYLLMLSCDFISPPKIVRHERIVEELKQKQSLGQLLSWTKGFEHKQDWNNPYFQGAVGVLVSSNDVKKSISILETALRENPECPELHFWLGQSWHGTGKAVEYYKMALKIRDEFPAALYFLAMTFIKLGHLAEAEESFKSAIALSPNFAEAHYQLASLYQHHLKEKSDIAREYFQKTVEIDAEGEMGKYAKAFLEGKIDQTRFGVRDESKGLPSLPKGLIIGISILSIFIIGGPISGGNPTIGIAVGVIVYLILTALFGRKG